MPSRDSKSDPVTIGCKGADAVRVLMAATHAFIAKEPIAIDPAAKLAIIIEELVSNSVEHGGSDDVELQLAHAGDAVLVTLSDTGRAFDPRVAETPGAMPERGGGAGIDLVRAWAEITDYRSADGWNRLSLSLKI